MKEDEYLLGGHHFWVHFWCGFVVGAGAGFVVGWHIFDMRWEVVALTAGTGLVLALCCGRWGESAWEVLAQLVGSWFWW
jgi:hypothetical protein